MKDEFRFRGICSKIVVDNESVSVLKIPKSLFRDLKGSRVMLCSIGGDECEEVWN